MQIETVRFGTIEVNDASIVHMPEGMLGFESCKRYVLIEEQNGAAFKWMQAVDDPAVAFIVINPTDFFTNYQVELPDEDASVLSITEADDAVVLTTVTVDSNAGAVTTNLVGPIVMNTRNMQARQVVLQDERYGTKHQIAEGESAAVEQEPARAA